MNWNRCFAATTLAPLATIPARAQTEDRTVKLSPTTMKRVGQVDQRCQSYNANNASCE